MGRHLTQGCWFGVSSADERDGHHVTTMSSAGYHP